MNMTAHECDPMLGQPNPTLTMSRVLRLLLAYFDNGDDDIDGAVGVIFTEVAACPDCLTGLTVGLLGFAVSLLPGHGPEVIDRLHQYLAAYLDQIASQQDES